MRLHRPRPQVRMLALVILGLIAVAVLFFSSFSSGLGKPVAHHIPVAVTAPPALLARLGASPMFSVHQVPDLTAARTLVKNRDTYGALALPQSRTATLLVAGGGGHAVAALLEQWGQQEAGARGLALHTVDLAPTSPYDPNGTAEFYCVIFLGIGGAAGAMALSRVLGPVRRRADAARAGAVVHRVAQCRHHVVQQREARRVEGQFVPVRTPVADADLARFITGSHALVARRDVEPVPCRAGREVVDRCPDAIHPTTMRPFAAYDERT
jgi:hypothetical protein